MKRRHDAEVEPSKKQDLDSSESDLQLSDEEDDPAAFEELICSLNPFLTWEAQRDSIVNDDRYLALDSNEKRANAFAVWAAKARESASNDSIEQYVALVREKHKPDRFYLEFRRKVFKDKRFSSCELKDKEKERIYREYSRLLKKSPEERAKALESIDAKDAVHLLFRDLGESKK